VERGRCPHAALERTSHIRLYITEEFCCWLLGAWIAEALQRRFISGCPRAAALACRGGPLTVAMYARIEEI
jgi:hypothetical protein